MWVLYHPAIYWLYVAASEIGVAANKLKTESDPELQNYHFCTIAKYLYYIEVSLKLPDE